MSILSAEWNNELIDKLHESKFINNLNCQTEQNIFTYMNISYHISRNIHKQRLFIPFFIQKFSFYWQFGINELYDNKKGWNLETKKWFEDSYRISAHKVGVGVEFRSLICVITRIFALKSILLKYRSLF